MRIKCLTQHELQKCILTQIVTHPSTPLLTQLFLFKYTHCTLRRYSVETQHKSRRTIQKSKNTVQSLNRGSWSSICFFYVKSNEGGETCQKCQTTHTIHTALINQIARSLKNIHFQDGHQSITLSHTWPFNAMTTWSKATTILDHKLPIPAQCYPPRATLPSHQHFILPSHNSTTLSICHIQQPSHSR